MGWMGSLELAGVEIGGGWSGCAAQMGMILIMSEVALATEPTSSTGTRCGCPGHQRRQQARPPGQREGDSRAMRA